jgi:PAS domain-containing protein
MALQTHPDAIERSIRDDIDLYTQKIATLNLDRMWFVGDITRTVQSCYQYFLSNHRVVDIVYVGMCFALMLDKTGPAALADGDFRLYTSSWALLMELPSLAKENRSAEGILEHMEFGFRQLLGSPNVLILLSTKCDFTVRFSSATSQRFLDALKLDFSSSLNIEEYSPAIDPAEHRAKQTNTLIQLAAHIEDYGKQRTGEIRKDLLSLSLLPFLSTELAKSTDFVSEVLRRVAKETNIRSHISHFSTSSAFVICDLIPPSNLPIIYVSDAFERLTGYRRSEIIGRHPRFLKFFDGPWVGINIPTYILHQRSMPCYKEDGRTFQNVWTSLLISFSD